MNRRVLALADALAGLGLSQATRAKIAASEGTLDDRLAAQDPRTRQRVELGLAFGWGIITAVLVALAVAADQALGRAASWRAGHVVFWVLSAVALGAAATCLLHAARMLRIGRRWPDG